MATDPHPEEKPCRVCGEKIAFAARKCIHCESWQDWRGALSVSSTVLALLVALISVATAAAPTVADWLTAKNAAFGFHLQSSAGNYLSVLISNSGVRPGTVLVGHVYEEGGILLADIFPNNANKQVPVVVAPNAVILVNFWIDPQKSHAEEEAMDELLTRVEISARNNSADTPQCRIEFDASDFYGKPANADIESPCAPLMDALRAQASGPPLDVQSAAACLSDALLATNFVSKISAKGHGDDVVLRFTITEPQQPGVTATLTVTAEGQAPARSIFFTSDLFLDPSHQKYRAQLEDKCAMAKGYYRVSEPWRDAPHR